MESYFDNAATTKAAPEVIDIMTKVLATDYGNPSSRHNKGMEAEEYIDNAREIIAGTLKCEPKNIVFTSGGTESNNQALISMAFRNERRGKHIITTTFEHASVHEPLFFLEKRGFEVSYVGVDRDGQVDIDELAGLVRDDTIIVSIMMVNNEVGAVQELENLVKTVKGINDRVIFHVDAIQGYAKYKIYPKKLGIDIMSVSGHKFHGPKGSGFLYISDKLNAEPYIYGGGQEKGLRSGTENVPAIAGIGIAAKLAYDNLDENVSNMITVKQALIDGIKEVEGAVFNINRGLDAKVGAPHILSVSFEGVKSEVLLHALEAEGVYVSSGSACSSNHPQLSGALKAIGVDNRLLDSTIRFSICRDNTVSQAEYAAEILKRQVPLLKKFRRY